MLHIGSRGVQKIVPRKLFITRPALTTGSTERKAGRKWRGYPPWQKAYALLPIVKAVCVIKYFRCFYEPMP